jgi:hypothetical protein
VSSAILLLTYRGTAGIPTPARGSIPGSAEHQSLTNAKRHPNLSQKPLLWASLRPTLRKNAKEALGVCCAPNVAKNSRQDARRGGTTPLSAWQRPGSVTAESMAVVEG